MLYIILGYIIEFVDITVKNFDVLPDFLGFALIAYGLNKYSDMSLNFQKAVPYAYLMCVLSVLSVVIVNWPISSMFYYFINFGPIVVLSICIAAGELYIIYCTSMGIADLEKHTGLMLYSAKFENLWKWIAGAKIGAFLILTTSMPLAIELVACLAVFAGVIAEISFVAYIEKVRSRLKKSNADNAG